MRSLPRRLETAVATLVLVLAFVVPVGPARVATDRTAAALDWLSDELAANGHQLGFKGAPGFTDWGLTIDFVLALAGGGRGGAAETTATTDNVLAHASSYITGDMAGELYAGPTAKLLYMAEVQGRPTSNVAGMNLETALRGRMTTSGNQTGRFTDQSQFGDFSNGFGQAFAVLALARTSGGVPSEALSFLLAQQCPAGGFRLFYDANATCGTDAEADPDATGLTLQALAGQSGTSTAISKAATWLLGHQDMSGAFSGAGPTAGLNANSTGIIAQGLRAVGQTAAANKAGTWIQSLQLTDTNAGAAAADIGAIAYDVGQRDDATANGLPTERDPFRRATSQGALALPQVVLPPAAGGGGGGVSPGATISVDTAKPGDTVAVGGSGFTPNEAVRFTLFSEPMVLGTVIADSNGLASLVFLVPSNTEPGPHTVEMLGLSSGKRLTASLQVTPSTTTTTTSTTTTIAGSTPTTTPPAGGGTATTAPTDAGTLPRTGEDATQGLPAAIALIAVGLVLVAIASRRVSRGAA